MGQRFELDSLQRTDSLCCPSPQTELLRNLKNKCVDEFEEILKKAVRKNLADVNYVYEDSEYKSLLDVACSSSKTSKFVDLLLRHGADINRINTHHKKAPIHFSVQYSDLDTIKILVENKNTDINLSDGSGNTALHLAVLHKKTNLVELLLKHPAIQVCKINRKCQTPLHIALSQNNFEISSLLLKNVDVDLDGIRDFADQTCRDMIKNKFPELEMNIVPKRTNKVDGNENLFQFLYNRDTTSFLSKINEKRSQIDENDGKYTYMQYACEYGLTEIVEALIKLGADPNESCLGNYRSPILIAAYKGYHEIVRLLVETGNVNFEPLYTETVLHAVVRGIKTCQHELLGTPGDTQDHRRCFVYLLNVVPAPKLYVNLPDLNNETALHYAVKANDTELIYLLLEKGAYLGSKNGANEMPIKFMHPKTLEKCFDDSIVENGQPTGAENYAIIYKYDLLAPPKICSPEEKKSVKFSTETGTVDEFEIISETEPLVEMSKVPELRPLLKHPLVTSFLNLKWYTIRKYFWVNVVFYVLFWLLLTIYILLIYKPSTPTSEPQNGINVTVHPKVDNAVHPRRHIFMWMLLMVFSALLLAREFFQFSISPWRYICSPENWLEVGLVVASFVILLGNTKSNDVKAQIAAAAILLSWTELVLLVGRHPLLSTNIEMFKVVTCNFLKFLAWYSILILAFAISFYLLFRDRETNNDEIFFRNPLMSLFKSVIMLTGEFEVGNIPFGNEPNTSHLLFVLFVFLIAIVLFNLLNGLAVSDTQTIRTNAELVGIICRAKLITYIETMATGDPFPYLNALEKITCFCCCAPCAPRRRKAISRRRRRNLPMFYRNINLFPHVFPDNQVQFQPNQDNKVIMPKSKGANNFNCNGRCDWKIDDPSVVEVTKHILLKNKLSNDIDVSSQNDVSKYSEHLKGYEEKFKALEESSKRTEQKLSEIMAILKQRL